MYKALLVTLCITLNACALLPPTPEKAVYTANRALSTITRELAQLCRKGTIKRSTCGELGSKLMMAKQDLLIANESVMLGGEVRLTDALIMIEYLEDQLRALK